MSYHSRAFPTHAAVMIRAALGCRTSCAGPVVPGAFDIGRPLPRVSGRWAAGAQLAEVPEQAGHDLRTLPGHGREEVLVGPVLGTRRVGVRHPDRRHPDDVGEDVVG